MLSAKFQGYSEQDKNLLQSFCYLDIFSSHDSNKSSLKRPIIV